VSGVSPPEESGIKSDGFRGVEKAGLSLRGGLGSGLDSRPAVENKKDWEVGGARLGNEGLPGEPNVLCVPVPESVVFSR